MNSGFNKALFLTIAAFLFFGGVNIMASEEPKYKVLKEYDTFEIREYSSYIVAETEISSNFDDAGNIAHRILFDYISGYNVKQEKMEMTVPVNQKNPDSIGEKIEMTAPVSQSAKLNSDGQYVISFVLPSRYTLETAPSPKDSRVTIRKVQKEIIAARKYSGSWSENNYRKNEQILLDGIKDAGLEITGQSIYARYDPPFMPWFLRRNEVLIEVNYNKL